MLIQPAVLASASYRQYRAEQPVVSAALLVTVGAAVIAALAVVPAGWACNAFLGSYCRL